MNFFDQEGDFNMRIVKYFSAWLAAVLVIVLAVNFGFGLIVSIFLGNTLVSSVMGYSKKWVYPLQEITEDQEKNPNANFIMLRTLFSNQTLVSLGGLYCPCGRACGYRRTQPKGGCCGCF